MKRLAIALGLFVTLGGCATHHTVRLDPLDRAGFEHAVNTVEGRRAALDFGTVRVLQAIDVRLGPDQVRWTTRDGGPYVVASSEIRSITVRNRGRGTLEGLASGVGMALLAAAVAWVCCETPRDVWIPNEIAAGIVVGVLSIPLGTLGGLVRGHPVIFELR